MAYENSRPFIGAREQKTLQIIELPSPWQVACPIGMLGITLAFMSAASLGASGSGFSPIKETGK
jgi:hypothetical protein